MLTAAFTPRLDAYAGRVGRLPGEIKLVVFAIDSLHVAIQTPSNHDSLKRTFSSKIGGNAVVCTVISGADSLPCWFGCLAASVSPANTDERLASMYLRLNSDGLPGGLLDFLTGPHTNRGPQQVDFHDFFTILLMDRGFKPYGRHAAGSYSSLLVNSSVK